MCAFKATNLDVVGSVAQSLLEGQGIIRVFFLLLFLQLFMC